MTRGPSPPPKEWQCRHCGARRWFQWAPLDSDRCTSCRPPGEPSPGEPYAGWIAVDLFEALERERRNRQHGADSEP